MHTRDRNTCKMFEQIANHGCCRKGDNDQGLNETLRRLAVFAPSLPSPSSPLFPPCGDIRTVVSSIAELALQSQQQPMPLPNSRVCQTVCKSKLATTLEPFPLLSPPFPPGLYGNVTGCIQSALGPIGQPVEPQCRAAAVES